MYRGPDRGNPARGRSRSPDTSRRRDSQDRDAYRHPERDRDRWSQAQSRPSRLDNDDQPRPTRSTNGDTDPSRPSGSHSPASSSSKAPSTSAERDDFLPALYRLWSLMRVEEDHSNAARKERLEYEDKRARHLGSPEELAKWTDSIREREKAANTSKRNRQDCEDVVMRRLRNWIESHSRLKGAMGSRNDGDLIKLLDDRCPDGELDLIQRKLFAVREKLRDLESARSQATSGPSATSTITDDATQESIMSKLRTDMRFELEELVDSYVAYQIEDVVDVKLGALIAARRKRNRDESLASAKPQENASNQSQAPVKTPENNLSLTSAPEQVEAGKLNETSKDAASLKAFILSTLMDSGVLAALRAREGSSESDHKADERLTELESRVNNITTSLASVTSDEEAKRQNRYILETSVQNLQRNVQNLQTQLAEAMAREEAQNLQTSHQEQRTTDVLTSFGGIREEITRLREESSKLRTENVALRDMLSLQQAGLHRIYDSVGQLRKSPPRPTATRQAPSGLSPNAPNRQQQAQAHMQTLQAQQMPSPQLVNQTAQQQASQIQAQAQANAQAIHQQRLLQMQQQQQQQQKIPPQQLTQHAPQVHHGQQQQQRAQFSPHMGSQSPQLPSGSIPPSPTLTQLQQAQAFASQSGQVVQPSQPLVPGQHQQSQSPTINPRFTVISPIYLHQQHPPQPQQQPQPQPQLQPPQQGSPHQHPPHP